MTDTTFTPVRPLWRTVGRRAAILLAAAAVLGTAACGASDGSTGPRNADPTGLYSLRQVGKDALPARIYRGVLGGVPNATVDVTGGELVLQDDDRFYLAMDFELSAAGESAAGSTSVEGNYEIEGGQLLLMSDDGVNGAQGTVRNGVITVAIDLVGDGTLKQYTFRYVP